MNTNTLFTIFIVIILSLVFFLKEENTKYSHLKDDAVILAFGDSLTRGFGAKEGASYPEVLQRKTNLKVINAGVNGELSSEGLKRLPMYLKNNPKLVILCHGGNDILNDLSKDDLKANLLSMVNLIRQSGAIVILVGVPQLSTFGLGVDKIYTEVAEETESIFEDDVLHEIQLNRRLKSDYVHPNEEGYERMADAFIQLLEDNNLW